MIHPTLLALAIASASWAVQAQSASTVQILSPVVVTAPVVVAPLVVETDPSAPRQPLPANDGADFLKSIPGFSVIRKGGTDGDPVFRGQAGSRLGILLDGQEIYGGCGNRMDPPTAYVYPESYDNVRVLKGPQSVLYGAGWSAGVALFERNFERFDEFGWRGHASLIFGSAARNDQVADMTVGTSQFYVRAGGSRAHAHDYKDGDGNTVHSAYRRWNTYGAVGWTPDDDTRIELSAALSDGEAAYADRGMDGSKFRRENLSLLFEKKNLTPVLSKIEARLYHNYVDHVMDNYSLRDNVTGMFSAMNPDRRTQGGRFSATLTPSDDWQVTLGTDFRQDRHRSRMGMGMNEDMADRYRDKSRSANLTFRQMGLFGEAQYELDARQRLISGLRVDWHEVEDKRAASVQRGDKDKRTLPSGFLRYEADFEGGYWYAGLGHSERFPDYWERMNKMDETGDSVTLNVKPEKLTQLDIGASYSEGPLSVAVSGFYGHVADYISLDWSGNSTVTRNIDARIMGGEVDASYRFNPNWLGTATLAYVFGQNRTDGRPLAQQPPLELRLGLNYEQGDYSVGALWRLAARQNRYDSNQGNLIGRDSGPTAGFGVLSLNAGWRVHPTVLVTAGVDNLLDKTYSEHLSRTGSGAVGIWPANIRINEPGRTFWLKMQAEF
ncbi:TonB-dependent copper receptor [Corticimicrobacter populi]|uniref:TonB-dependent copper receptor n=1 Tax=Corticimicrobacter populi TaxID=2175229 RepID=UPI001EFC6882|nr:TonB-dependent copper receptor [Corticimicrobacter populi]